MNNRIYQSPDLYTVVSNRLVSNSEAFCSENEPNNRDSLHHSTHSNHPWTRYELIDRITHLGQVLFGQYWTRLSQVIPVRNVEQMRSCQVETTNATLPLLLQNANWAPF